MDGDLDSRKFYREQLTNDRESKLITIDWAIIPINYCDLTLLGITTQDLGILSHSILFNYFFRSYREDV